jgi:hypothetical protein
VSEVAERLMPALADRYRIERGAAHYIIRYRIERELGGG